MRRTALLTTVMLLALGAAPHAVDARSRMKLLSESQMNQMGTEAFEKLKAGDKLSKDEAKRKQVQCIVNGLLPQLPENQRKLAWEVQVFDNPEPNAFALPGGKVGVNMGMFDIAKTQDEMAAVIGHEIAHVVSEHSNERVSRQLLAGVGLQFLGSYTGNRTSPEKAKMIMGALGAGAQVGLILPHSRNQETEADLLGQRYMAQAGFDPAKAATLWQNMMAARKNGVPPKILSTHPNPEVRIKRLEDNRPSVQPLYDATKKNGARAACY